ncbi:MAG: hypothetical protein DWI57_10325 [Chloroflexi bacterium]|nr:MAG: hypothetical protein DWI57_10325 [Chloroflexota bacterium]
MNRRTVFVISSATIVLVLALVLAFRLGGLPRWASAPAAEAAPLALPGLIDSELPLAQITNEKLILSYAAKFVCTEALPPGTFWYGLAAPIVNQETQVLIHNPHDFNITFYKKAVIAPLEDQAAVAPGKWNELKLGPDYAVRINCDDIAFLLTGKPGATFAGTYGYGVTVEGFVVIGIGVQSVPNANGTVQKRYAPLDVTAEYERSSEVLKKDIHYQPWWWWWWWQLPWKLGYPYERLVTIDPTGNIDCRELLYQALAQDAQRMENMQERQATLAALNAGRQMGPNSHVSENPSAETPAALVAMVGNCRKLDTATADIDYVLLSNKGMTDPNPITAVPAQASLVRYPWFPGHWYDLAMVTPQNLDVDLSTNFHQWQSKRWIAAGETSATVSAAMAYYFPWWCGWGYWYWWWNGGDCTDIGVGEGESLDVESVAPQRVFMNKWPPIP